MGVAESKADELVLAQKELHDYADVRLKGLNDTVEGLMKMIRTEQTRVATEFEAAVGEEDKRLAAEIGKYEKNKEELKAKSVDLGNMIESLCIPMD